MRAVIADDEKYVLLVLEHTLQEISIPIEVVGTARNGREAYALCMEKKPDILITDICMPDKDGLDLLEALRREMPYLPVIIYSGYDNFSYAQQAIHYGIEEYLLKPIDAGKLERAVGAVMSRMQKERRRKARREFPGQYRMTAAIRLGKREYLRELLESYWKELLEDDYQENPEEVKEAAKNMIGQEMLLLGLSWENCREVTKYREKFAKAVQAEEVRSLLQECGTLLMELYQEETGNCSEKDQREVILEFLQNNCNRSLTLEELAEYLHFNASYASDLFRKRFGKSFIPYVTDMRMETAKSLLKSGRFKVYEVAEQVGYQDEKYFQKIFKKCVGCTPKEYQRQSEAGMEPFS